MSVTLRHPFSLDAAGAVATVEQGSARHAVECALHVAACRIGERPLAPLWGLGDPLADGVDETDVRAAMTVCEPDVALSYVELRGNPDGSLDLLIDATWRQS